MACEKQVHKYGKKKGGKGIPRFDPTSTLLTYV